MAAAVTYSMAVGERDAARLALLDQHYNPGSRAFLDSTRLGPGDTVVDIGCGHGTMTRWLAERVGPTGLVYAVDAAAEQLDVARRVAGDLPQVRFVHARVEELPLESACADWVYSRFLLMHVPDPATALMAMRRLLTEDGALLLENSDIGALRFVPADDPAAELWRDWWYALGRARGVAHDVCDRLPELLARAGFIVARSDRFQPVSAMPEAKMLHAIGFEQCVPAYLELAGARQDLIDAHRSYLERVIPDTGVAIELYSTTQFLARIRQPARGM